MTGKNSCKKIKMDDDNRIKEMIEYYRERAPEYDEWFFRKGRYDRGNLFRQKWFNEIKKVRHALINIISKGDVLELACGTGIWTQTLANHSKSVTAIDTSPEVIKINKKRLNAGNVDFVIADIFKWQPERKYDLMFFGFWLSHVPEELFDRFWHLVKTALKPDGKVFFIDNLFSPESSAHESLNRSGKVERKLNDGRRFEIVKIFYEPIQLEEKLISKGWTGNVHSSGQFFFYGSFKFKT